MVCSVEHYKFDRREINAVNGSKNIAGRSKNIEISIWCGSQTKDESKRNGQKRAAKLHLSGFSLDIYLAMPKRSVASAPNISMN